ncbi:trypsin inhibitor like cysteine rich domain-containing protein [Ditylenchus destructor]|uniref:Trypsin inhibitor like cysteine rich domain-containing protein n=1 Tax=Ditylenchus destructor TaxID=166010 RepID=A0AAD4QVS9_9BILA|nr:trypsin inhibitor like cysteine rich domain-containing protein [Ditylenchus destructor]
MTSKVLLVGLLTVVLQVCEAIVCPQNERFIACYFDAHRCVTTIVCPPNERFDGCGKKCEPSCHYPNPVCILEECKPEDFGCRCEEVLYRDDTGTTGTCVKDVGCTVKK